MHYVIHCLDKPNSVEKRLAHYDAHKAYISNAPLKMVISGPLLADDEETMIGSCFLLEAKSLQEVEAFNREDPFYKADLWAQISIRPFNKRVDNRA
ncbi:YciI family protein [Rhizobium sp. C4]|uniref:YciI family protein n=1 Tax=Rhizobium sp. C4 TaxID=1349800 RepID=UPI001E5222A4|nr:YciI family protein [Rhizobium sp. C4]MCD2172528.1 YciI family protein [Rhizobium sp. C4]